MASVGNINTINIFVKLLYSDHVGNWVVNNNNNNNNNIPSSPVYRAYRMKYHKFSVK